MSKKFENLVKEAVAAYKEYESHVYKPRLTAQAFIGECLHRGNSDPEKRGACDPISSRTEVDDRAILRSILDVAHGRVRRSEAVIGHGAGRLGQGARFNA